MANGSKKIVVRHLKTGEETTIGEAVWKDWKAAKSATPDVRQGYVMVKELIVDDRGKVLQEIPARNSIGPKPVTFVPDFKEEAPADPVQQKQPEQQPVLEPVVQGSRDNLAAIPSLGIKVAAALTQAGISTYEGLTKADPKAIEAVLNGMVPPMGPKAAQIPTWQKAAAEFVKQATAPVE